MAQIVKSEVCDSGVKFRLIENPLNVHDVPARFRTWKDVLHYGAAVMVAPAFLLGEQRWNMAKH